MGLPNKLKPTNFGFGIQTGSQFQRSGSQQQQGSDPFGFGIQGNFQPRKGNQTVLKQNQFKPFENKWTRFSSSSNVSGGAQEPRRSDNQPAPANHKCTDPDTCKRQIIEDFEHERPLWKLTCYGHSKSAPCDISGDISSEELRAAAYNDASRGLSLQSIVERERSLLNTKLLEFETLLQNPCVLKDASTTKQSVPYSGVRPSAPSTTTLNNVPPSFSSFSQLGGSLKNMGFGVGPDASPQNYAFGQQNSIQVPPSQTQSGNGMNVFPFGGAVDGGRNIPSQQPQGNFFCSNAASFSNSAVSSCMDENNTSFPSPASSQIPNLPSGQSPIFSLSHNSAAAPVDTKSRDNGTVADDDSIWFKEEWKLGEIPEEAPPDKYIS